MAARLSLLLKLSALGAVLAAPASQAADAAHRKAYEERFRGMIDRCQPEALD
jgi:hypothetical protein